MPELLHLSLGCLTAHPQAHTQIIGRKFHDFCYIVTPCVNAACLRKAGLACDGNSG